MTALAMDVRELSFGEIDLVSGGHDDGLSWREIGIAVGLGVLANVLTPVVVAVAPVVILGAAINLAIATPAH